MTDSQSQTFRVGLVQMRSSRRLADNLRDADQLIREAAAAGAQYVLTPENTPFLELDKYLSLLQSQPFESNSALAMFRALARELNIWLHVGSLAVKLEDGEHLANRSCLISPSGAIAAWYDKIHLFDVDLGGGESYIESNSYRAGHKAILADLPFVRLGFSICYDLRFPGLYRLLAKAGAQMIAVPAAFTEQTGRAHWHVLLRARAIESGCYIVAAAQGGRHDIGRSTYGHSLVVGPWGDVIAEAGEEPGVITADIDLAEVTRARSRIPALQHDRPFEVFSPQEAGCLEEVS